VEQQRQPEAVAARSADGGDDTQESKLGFEAFAGFVAAGNRSGWGGAWLGDEGTGGWRVGPCRTCFGGRW
jgi:hypothetical protein